MAERKKGKWPILQQQHPGGSGGRDGCFCCGECFFCGGCFCCGEFFFVVGIFVVVVVVVVIFVVFVVVIVVVVVILDRLFFID